MAILFKNNGRPQPKNEVVANRLLTPEVTRPMEEDREKSDTGGNIGVADLKGRRVLEIGCGDGRVTAMLAGIPQRLVAIDPDAGCIEKARHQIAEAVFAAGSGEALPFGAEPLTP